MIELDNLTFLDNMDGIHRDECTSRYQMDEGLEVIPVMGPRDTPPVVVRLHAAYTVRKSTFNYGRSKAPPVIPVPGDTPSGHTFLGGTLAVAAPTPDAYGNLSYRAGGEYMFVLPSDLREYGKIRFDAHGYRSKVDFLGFLDLKETDVDWNSPNFDLNILGSARILG